MKWFLFKAAFLFLFINSTLHSQTGWYLLPSVTSETIHDLNNFSNIWLTGDNGIVFKSSDNGDTWVNVNANTNTNLMGIHQPTSSQFWIAGDSGVVVVSIDAGNTWEMRSPNTNASFSDIFSRGSGVAYAIGENGTCFYSTDIGNTWQQRTVPTTEDLYTGIGPTIGTAALVGGSNGIMYKTTDAGVNWYQITSGTSEDINGLGFGPVNSIFAVCDGGVILVSTDLGETFTPVVSPTTEDLYSVRSSQQNANWLIACGDNGTIIKSTDGGVNWFLQSTPTTELLNTVLPLTNNLYIAAGENGTIIKTTDGGGDPVSVNEENNSVSEFKLYQNYPNPFNPSTKIKFTIPVMEEKFPFILLRIYDVLGNEITTLVNENLPAGEYEFEFDTKSTPSFRLTRNLTSGIYFYTLRSSGFIETKMMILIK